MMKTTEKLLFLTLGIISLAFVFLQRNLCSTLDLAAITAAADEYEVEEEKKYYEIKIKLVWDQPVGDYPCNLDLYVVEPSGDTASKNNTTTSSGGELGFYDSYGYLGTAGTWYYGDSGYNYAPEVYRVEYGLAGVYDIYVFCNQYEEVATSAATPLPILTEEEEKLASISEFGANIDIAGIVTANALYDVSANAYVHVTLYGESAQETYLRFPESGTVEIASNQDDGWWHAGSFNFVPIAEKPLPDTWWDIEKDPRCFIATAAYESTLAPGVQILCLFRDRYLANNKPGRLILKFYYKISPPAAKVIQKSNFLKILARIYLNPIIKILELFTE
ncbi:hypothetical protein KAW50_07920 [candidate division WOR-3 bacterium]|nr:hypothetical protein [candidate division WOR-3 bacterium]